MKSSCIDMMVRWIGFLLNSMIFFDLSGNSTVGSNIFLVASIAFFMLIRKVSIGDEAFYTIPLTICLVFVIIDADVDTKDEKKTGIDIFYPKSTK